MLLDFQNILTSFQAVELLFKNFLEIFLSYQIFIFKVARYFMLKMLPLKIPNLPASLTNLLPI